MIDIIKVGDTVYERVEERIEEPIKFDEEGFPVEFREIWNPDIPSSLEGLRNALLETVRWQAFTKLKPTDWIIVKSTELKVDANIGYPNEVKARQEIRDWCNKKEKEIQACKSIDALIALRIRI